MKFWVLVSALNKPGIIAHAYGPHTQKEKAKGSEITGLATFGVWGQPETFDKTTTKLNLTVLCVFNILFVCLFKKRTGNAWAQYSICKWMNKIEYMLVIIHACNHSFGETEAENQELSVIQLYDSTTSYYNQVIFRNANYIIDELAPE